MLDFKEKKYFLILFPIIFQLFLFITSNRVEKIFLIFRMDDYSTDSNSEIESKIFEIFSKDSLPIIVGITPFSYDDSNNLIPLGYKKKELIFKYLDQKNFSIALHGYSHKNFSKENRYKYEFTDLPLEKQNEMIVKGKGFIDSTFGKNVKIFIPPWNGYDDKTIYALEKNNFQLISAGIRGFHKKTNLKFLPLTGTIKDLEKSLEHAKKSREKNPLIIVNFHSFEFKNDNYLENFKNELKRLKQNRKIVLVGLEELLENFSLSDEIFIKNKKRYFILSLAPEFWYKIAGYSSLYYYNEGSFTKFENLRLIFSFLNYIFLVFVLSYSIFSIFSKKISGLLSKKIVLPFGSLLIILSSIYIFSNLRISSKGITFLSAIFSFFFFIIKERKPK